MDALFSPLLTAQDVAIWLGMPTAKVAKLARKGQIPCVIVPPDEVRFDAAVLKSWLDQLPTNKGAKNAD